MLRSQLPLRDASPIGTRRAAALVLILFAIPSLGPVHAQQGTPAAEPTAVTSAGAEWRMPARDFANTRFSPLAQINTENVQRLKEEFHFETGIQDGHEGAPLVVGNTMYVVSPFPNTVFALDLNKPGRTRWVFHPTVDEFAEDKACCDKVNRGAVFARGKIIFNTLDDQTFALDANTGRVIWRTKLGDPARGQTITMAPLVVHDKVIVGNSGGEMGVRGFIAALDLNTGRLVWKAFTTGPDRDVLIGKNFKPFYAKDRGTNLGATTWPGTLWREGGSTVWAWLSYDPHLNLLYHGTANPGVWNPDMRPGDNKWSTTIFARNPDTGEARWAYQITPHDAWDYDGVNENILANFRIGDRLVRALVHFDRNGFAYTLDRVTGQVLVAKPYVDVNWATGIDLTTGKPTEDPTKRTHEGELVSNICPGYPGGKDLQPAAFSPRTRLFYVPTNNLCMDHQALKALFIAGTPFVGASVKLLPGPGGNRGAFIAWDARTGTKVWEIKETFPVWSGALVTAGDVAFYGTMDNLFKAVDARTGRVLFETKLGSGIIGHPMTFLGPDGKQRVAVYSGIGGTLGGIVPGQAAPDDPFAGGGAMNALRDLLRATRPGGAVHVFKLE
jgi:PQQ-dependent dehydrogenase (methanol/ethanol family)